MTKDYIKDDGKVRLCTRNVAKMNILESMYHHRGRMWDDVIDVVKELCECWSIFVNVFIIIMLPLSYPIMAWLEIKRARKEMKRHEASKS